MSFYKLFKKEIKKNFKQDFAQIKQEALESWELYMEDLKPTIENIVVRVKNRGRKNDDDYIVIDKLPKHTIFCECPKCQPNFKRWARDGLK